MENPLCGPTAYRYYRIPPQILLLYPPLETPFQDSNHKKLSRNSTVTDLLRAPLHRLVSSKNNRAATSLYVTHTCTAELPFGCFQETEHNFSVTSPLFTLLTLAPHVSRIRLLMAMYELCGSFAVFKPAQRTEAILQSAYDQGFIPLGAGWERVKDANGNATSLWKRDPLIALDELHDFAERIEGLKGAKPFRWAAERITGVCASPFEVEASLLIGLPRRAGGMGLPILNNQRISLTQQAHAIYPHECCYADLYIEQTDKHPPLDIECQSHVIHNGGEAGISDAERLSALEGMGVNVLPLTHRQISLDRGFEATKQLIASKLNMRLAPKTPAQQEVERKLRNELFIDWNELVP